MRNTKYYFYLIVILCIFSYFLFTKLENLNKNEKINFNENMSLVEVKLPNYFSESAKIGKHLFNEKCSACHGLNAAGVKGYGPPLIHKIYEPSHHGDESFQRAVEVGVIQHHWSFGKMASISGIEKSKVAKIITYIRELQRENGIK